MQYFLKYYDVNDNLGHYGKKYNRIIKRLLINHKNFKYVLVGYSSRDDGIKTLLHTHGISYLRMSRRDIRYCGHSFYMIESEDDINYLKLFEKEDKFSTCLIVYSNGQG